MLYNKKQNLQNTIQQDNCAFINNIVSTTEGNKILTCIQCDIYNATYPVNEVMDYTPRQIFVMICNGMKDKVLSSDTP